MTEYQKLFQMFSDIDILNAFIFLHSRDDTKPFTPNLLAKGLSIPMEKAEFILENLNKYGYLHKQEIQLDDEIKEVNTFKRSKEFVALLIIAKGLITRPTSWNFNSTGNMPSL